MKLKFSHWYKLSKAGNVLYPILGISFNRSAVMFYFFGFGFGVEKNNYIKCPRCNSKYTHSIKNGERFLCEKCAMLFNNPQKVNKNKIDENN